MVRKIKFTSIHIYNKLSRKTLLPIFKVNGRFSLTSLFNTTLFAVFQL